MARTLKDIQEQRGTIVTALKKFRDDTDAKAGVEKRAWSKEEDAKFAEISADLDALDREAERARRFEAIDAGESKKPGREDVAPGKRSGDGDATDETRGLALAGWLRGARASREEREAADMLGFDMRSSVLDISPAPTRDIRAMQQVYRDRRGSRLAAELRDLSLTGASGGYTTVPGTLVRSLEQARLQYGGIAQLGEIIRTATGEPMYFPAADDSGNVGALVAEAGDLDIEVSVDPTFARMQLDSFKITSKPILVSHELLRDSVFDLPAVIGSMLGERIGRKEAALYATGTGSSQPKGLTVAATAATLSSGNAYTASATDITGDELLDLAYSVDPAYRGQGCGFVMKDSTLLLLRKKKGTDGQYIWQPGWQAGAPDMLHGFPVTTCQEMPAATAGLRSVVFGLLSAYKIRQVGAVRLRRLEELFANTDQVGFIALASVDADLLDAGTHPVKALVQHA